MYQNDPVRPAPAAAYPPRPSYPRGTRLLVGSVVSFTVASLLYGPSQVIQLLLFATICTVGIGLVLILVACWMVGWVVMEIWISFKQRNPAPSTS